LFEQGADATSQLMQCLLASVVELSNSITVGVQGTTSSFYYLLVEELLTLDAENVLQQVVNTIAKQIRTSLGNCESVLDGDVNGSPVVLVSGLTALCLHKRAALALAQCEEFSLPAVDSPEAVRMIHPALPMRTGRSIWQMNSAEYRPYMLRSGPGIEKHTVLGAALAKGIPKANSAFSPINILRQSLEAVERATSGQRSQLRTHQEACNQLVIAIIKAGPEARRRVMQWFIDALLVNEGASAMRPDPSKVSSSNMLLNMSVVLLKLCEPFVIDAKKHHLIDPGFVMSEPDHGGVFVLSGENAVVRLGENVSTDMTDLYHPKNAFIPQCFFLCARSLHFGVVPLLSYHESLLRHISHAHWEITSNHRDLQSDPQFTLLVSRQRSNEVALFQEEMITDTLGLCNLMAKVLWDMSDDVLRTMPEDFVSDLCNILMGLAKFKGKLLRHGEYNFVFKLVVKLLLPTYASVSAVFHIGMCTVCAFIFTDLLCYL
jgi:hypothetical protein